MHKPATLPHMSIGSIRPVLRAYYRIGSRRLTTSAADAAEQLLHNFSGQTITRRQILDANQLQKLSLTLNRTHIYPEQDISAEPPATGTPIPPGYHLVYFTPDGVEGQLGADGTDQTFNAPLPFSRRMWAGGKMHWNADSPLRVGEEAEERTRLLSATAKKSRSGGEMVLVEVEKELWGKKGLAMTDQRSWIFRTEATSTTTSTGPGGQQRQQPSLAVARGPSVIRDVASDSGGFPKRQLRWSPVGLFRFSALTFNGHMIHYNEHWTKTVEDHPAVIVHGPLNLINILDYWRDVHGHGSQPKQVTYRAMSPIYAGESYSIGTQEVREENDGGKLWEILAMKNGVTCMKGEILGSVS